MRSEVGGTDLSAVELQDGTRAIEVAALFEDSVVDVRHLTDPRTGSVTRETRLWIGTGVAALGAALASFIVAYAQVAATRAAWAAWDAAGKAHNEFVTPRDGVTLDVLAVLGLTVGVAALLRGLARLRREQKPAGYTIGPDRGTSFHAPGDALPVSAFPLVRSTGSDYELVFLASMDGDATLDGHTLPLAELVTRNLARPSPDIAGAHAWPIAPNARVRLTLGQNTYLVSSVPAPRRHAQPLLVDWTQQSYTAGCALAAALFLAMMFSVPPDSHSLSVDAFLKNDRFPVILLKPPLDEQTKLPTWLNASKDGERGGETGAPAKGPAGKMGKEHAKNRDGLVAVKGPANNHDTRIARQLAQQAAQNAGILGIMAAQQGSHIAAIWGSDTALGHDADNVMSGLFGTQVQEADGVPGGLGIFGKDKGGGGSRETIGVGKLPTIGKNGLGPNGGWGPPSSRLKDKPLTHPELPPTIGPIKVRGGIDREIVRRVIHRHLNEVKFCYEKELTLHPDLFGRVVTDFTIAGTGQVLTSAVQSTTLNNTAVEQCIAGAVRRWEFPKPDGGGVVVVSYPFVLKSSGAN